MTSVIGLITAASLNGWRLDDYTIPKNRTREQYDFEGTFVPMFKFLEEEKKDFTGLKGYISHVYIEHGDEVKKYSVDLDITQADIKGDYTITIGDKEETVPVTYSNGKLTYSSEISPLFDEEILNLVVKRDVFDSLNVKRTLRTGTTELSEIIYQPENHSELFKHLKNKYDMREGTTCRIRIKHSSGTIYGISIQMKSKDKVVQIDLMIFKQ